MPVDNEQVLTRILWAIYKKADREHLDENIVSDFVSDLQRIFHKNPKKKEKRCFACKGVD